ncbi:hypothetical protein K9M48_04205 [Candidatus Gracilibacteria bacterium]|nr:hypothetical protein [Candidatus Gracilibacteria bacterium]
MSDQELRTTFEEVKNKIESDGANFDTIKFNDETRGKIGKIFVWGFFIAIFGSIVVTILYNVYFYYLTQDTDLFLKLDSILTLMGSIIGAPLGFVMGYYFKTDKD